MGIHKFRKALGLLIVDIVIIIGIFVLQFRTDSTIIEKLGQLTISMEKQETDSSDIVLNNKLQIAYNGVSFYCDDQNPVVTKNDLNETQKLALISYEKQNDNTFLFDFTQDVKLEVSVSSLDSDATMAIHAYIPETISTVYVPYNYSYNMKIKKSEEGSIVFDNKKASWELQGLSFADGYAEFDQTNFMIAYSQYIDIQKFTFESVSDLPIAAKTLYENNVKAITNNLISAFSSTSDSSITEQAVISYVAAMGDQGSYNKALDNIPQSFKNGKDRTYSSAPYLGNLSSNDDLLQKTIKENENLISTNAASGSLNVFGIRNLAAYMCIHPKAAEVVSILTNAAKANIEECTLSQVSGILQTYVELYDLNKDYAAILSPILEDCIEKVTSLTSLNGNILTISENDTFLSVIQAVEIGTAVLRYGIISENQVLINAGYGIINSYISESSSFDLRTLSNIYPLIAYTNWYYPHFKKIEVNRYNTIWAWTCAKDIVVTTHTNDDLVLNVDFPEGLTHYVIIKGIPKFHNIYIYNMSFRTDPRFETYNSSGYVYRKETKTLLLKSRHKSKIEELRLEIGDEPAPVSTPKPKAVEKKSVEKPVAATEETADTTAASTDASATGENSAN